MENGTAEAEQSWTEVSFYSTGAWFSPLLSRRGPRATRAPPALSSALLEVQEEELELAWQGLFIKDHIICYVDLDIWTLKSLKKYEFHFIYYIKNLIKWHLQTNDATASNYF